jgi:hypothetical protein
MYKIIKEEVQQYCCQKNWCPNVPTLTAITCKLDRHMKNYIVTRMPSRHVICLLAGRWEACPWSQEMYVPWRHQSRGGQQVHLGIISLSSLSSSCNSWNIIGMSLWMLITFHLRHSRTESSRTRVQNIMATLMDTSPNHHFLTNIRRVHMCANQHTGQCGCIVHSEWSNPF